jgi:hypothetical protein
MVKRIKKYRIVLAESTKSLSFSKRDTVMNIP